MSLHFDTVTIIGVGLLGGSLGLALKKRRLATTIRGVGRRQVSLDKAREIGAIDSAHLNVAEAARGADLIVICTPVALVPQMMDAVRPRCAGTGAVVTDVASTKQWVCAHAAATWPKPLRFIGSHPMAGSERFGPEYADANLYEGTVALVQQKDDRLDSDAHNTVTALWQAVGATVIEIDPARHDAILSRTSHVPHVVAACIARLVARQETIQPFVGPGFRDVTRIAASRPEVWRDICLTNREAILQGLDELGQDMAGVTRMIAEGRDDALLEFFQNARDARGKAVGK